MRISDWSSDVCSSDLIDYADGKTFLFWNRPDTINIHTEVSYTNQAGETQTFLVSPDSSSLLIPDWKPATKIFYRSTYKPEREAIDTFRVSYYDSLDEIGRASGRERVCQEV